MKPIILYGAGQLGRLAKEILDNVKCPVELWLDKKHGNERYPVIDTVEDKEKYLVAVAVSTEPYGEIVKSLENKGFKNFIPVWHLIENFDDAPIKNGWTFKIENEDKSSFLKTGGMWEDGCSWYHYTMFVNWHAGLEIETLKWAPVGIEDRWFPEFAHNALRPGAVLSDGENEGLYPYRMLPDDESTLDAVLKRRYVKTYFPKYNYIKIHAEGLELDTIKVNMHVFQKSRPIIAVTVYHSSDGIWKIEKELMDNLDNYLFYFRMHAHMGLAAIMYCIPKERVQ